MQCQANLGIRARGPEFERWRKRNKFFSIDLDLLSLTNLTSPREKKTIIHININHSAD